MATYDDGVPEDWYPGYFLDPRPARRLLRRRHHRPQQAAGEARVRHVDRRRGRSRVGPHR